MIRKFLSVGEEPWVSPETRNWLDFYLKKNMIVFEYGSGGSTVFFAKRVKKIISVEYQRFWFVSVVLALLCRGKTNFFLHLYPPERDKKIDRLYMSNDPNINMFSYKKFVQSIDSYPNHFFDLVFVDGRARNQCIKHSLPKVKNNGYLLLDDSERTIYNPGEKLLAKFKKTVLNTVTVWKIT